MRKRALVASATQVQVIPTADAEKEHLVKTLRDFLPELSKATDRVAIIKVKFKNGFASPKKRLREIHSSIIKSIEILRLVYCDLQKNQSLLRNTKIIMHDSNLHCVLDEGGMALATMFTYREMEDGLRAFCYKVEEYADQVKEEEIQLAKDLRALWNLKDKAERVLQDPGTVKNAALKRMLNKISEVLDEVTDALELRRMWVALEWSSWQEEIRFRLAYEIQSSFEQCQEDLERWKALLQGEDHADITWNAVRQTIATAQEGLKKAWTEVEAVQLRLVVDVYETRSIPAAVEEFGDIIRALLDVRRKILAGFGKKTVSYSLDEVIALLP
ncbi:hypothetical protein EV368DRAFT_78694 [Lentinula lateritia]|nr:hypothetical protein EV368DRAFT_78694 [Lentinula lateritia]